MALQDRVQLVAIQSRNARGALVGCVQELNDIAEAAATRLDEEGMLETLAQVSVMAGQLDAAIASLRALDVGFEAQSAGQTPLVDDDGIIHVGGPGR